MNLLLQTLLFILGAMFLLWLVSILLRDASIVDIFWGAGFACVAMITMGHQVQFRLPELLLTRQTLVGSMTIIWGLRLALYLGWRNLGRGEDPRYQAMRNRYAGSFPLLSLPLVFILQGALIWLISLPVQVTGKTAPGFGAGDGIGVGIWLAGLIFESVGDWQLARFKADPASRGRVLDRGLWAWTRHPNYFGDALVWWGLSIPVIVGGVPWVIVSPLIMTWLLLRFSGVPLLEKGLLANRPGYADYIERTSKFFPRPPRRGRQ